MAEGSTAISTLETTISDANDDLTVEEVRSEAEESEIRTKAKGRRSNSSVSESKEIN